MRHHGETERRRHICDMMFVEATVHQSDLKELSTLNGTPKEAKGLSFPCETHLAFQRNGGLIASPRCLNNMLERRNWIVLSLKRPRHLQLPWLTLLPLLLLPWPLPSPPALPDKTKTRCCKPSPKLSKPALKLQQEDVDVGKDDSSSL